MSEIFDMLCNVAGNAHFDAKVLNNEEFEDIKNDILRLQEKYRSFDLTEEERTTIDMLIKTNAELYEEGIAAVYRQGFLDCADLLRDLKVL